MGEELVETFPLGLSLGSEHDRYKDKGGRESPGEICEMGGGGGRYAIIDSPGVLLIVEDLTEAARR